MAAAAIGAGLVLAAAPSGSAGQEAAVRTDALPAASAALAGPRLPVLLVPGWGDGPGNLEPLRRRFLEAGWSPDRVEVVDFEDPVGSNRAHAREIAAAVVEVLRRTGADRVDVVAHSMGGLGLRYHLLGGDSRVRRVVFLGTPHRGTVTAFLAWGEGGREMEPGSDFLLHLNGELFPLRDVSVLTVRTPIDLRILPNESAVLPGAVNREICCPTHEGLLDDEETFDVMRRFLLREDRGRSPPDGGVARRGGPER